LAFVFEVLWLAWFCEEVFEGVVRGLQPRLHFFFNASGEEPDVFAGWHDDSGDEHFFVVARLHLFECGSDCKEGFSGPCFAVDGDERDVRVVESVEKEALAEVEGLEGSSASDGDMVAGERNEDAVLFVSGWHAMAGGVFVSDEEVLVGGKTFFLSWKMDEPLASEGLDAISWEFERLIFLVAVSALGSPNVIIVFDTVSPIVLSIESEGARFELKV
jgi:hypothetical protein